MLSERITIARAELAPLDAELKRMYVSPDVRGEGLGRRLVAALEAEARALGARRLVLETGICLGNDLLDDVLTWGSRKP